jgi:hypothetical protein
MRLRLPGLVEHTPDFLTCLMRFEQLLVDRHPVC